MLPPNSLFACRFAQTSTPHPSPDQLAHVPPSPRSTCPPAESSIRLLCIAQALGFPYFTLLSHLVQGCKCGCRKFWLMLLGFFFFFSVSCVIPDTPDGKLAVAHESRVSLLSRRNIASLVACVSFGNLVCWEKQVIASSSSGSS